MRHNFKFGDKFLLAPKTDFGGIYSTLVAGYYAPFINSIGSDDVILDGGANVGAFTIAASKFAKLVISVEPNSENFRYLVHNIKANKIENVVPINAALSSYDGVVNFAGEGEIGHISSNGIKIDSVTIDSLEDRFNIRFSGIKLDIEGAEPIAILGGGKKAINHVKRIIYELDERQFFAINTAFNSVDSQFSYEELNRHLENIGFTLISYKPDFQRLKLLKENICSRRVKIRDIIFNEVRNNFWFELETFKSIFSSRYSNEPYNYDFMMIYASREFRSF